mgnify:FL=1
MSTHHQRKSFPFATPLWGVRPRALLLLVGGLACIGAPQVHAQPVVLPPGLGGSQSYRLMFVTAGTRDALSGNITDYNTFVNSAANAVPELAALGTEFRVLGSTQTVNARDNLDFGGANDVPIFRLDGNQIANNNADLFDDLILNPINVDELGNPVGDQTVFTGSFTDGTLSGVQSFGAGATTLVGSSAATDGDYIFGTIADSDTAQRFYALSGVLTIPEPATATLLLFCAVGLLHRGFHGAFNAPHRGGGLR